MIDEKHQQQADQIIAGRQSQSDDSERSPATTPQSQTSTDDWIAICRNLIYPLTDVYNRNAIREAPSIKYAVNMTGHVAQRLPPGSNRDGTVAVWQRGLAVVDEVNNRNGERMLPWIGDALDNQTRLINMCGAKGA
jgi:hypothetical protein